MIRIKHVNQKINHGFEKNKPRSTGSLLDKRRMKNEINRIRALSRGGSISTVAEFAATADSLAVFNL